MALLRRRVGIDVEEVDVSGIEVVEEWGEGGRRGDIRERDGGRGLVRAGFEAIGSFQSGLGAAFNMLFCHGVSVSRRPLCICVIEACWCGCEKQPFVHMRKFVRTTIRKLPCHYKLVITAWETSSDKENSNGDPCERQRMNFKIFVRKKAVSLFAHAVAYAVRIPI